MQRFDVVIPSLNQGAFVGAAVRSVIDQRDVRIELVVVDGCSSDDSLAAVESAISDPGTAHVDVISEPDRGQSHAINKGARLGSAEIVSWLNADDRLLPGALARVAHAFERVSADVVAVYGDVRFIDAAGRDVGEAREGSFSRSDLLFGPNYIPQPATFIRRAAWEAVGGLREDLDYAMDFDLWLSLSEIGRFAHLSELLAEFRLHGGSKTGRAYDRMRREGMAVRAAHARKVLGRTPSRLELEARLFASRCRRRIRSGLGGIGVRCG